MVRSMVRVVGAAALVTTLALGPAAPPTAAYPTDTYLPNNTWSPQYNVGGCLYKFLWGQFGTVPVVYVNFYNLSSCGGGAVGVIYRDSSGTERMATSGAVSYTSSDGCGPYQQIFAYGPPPGVAERAFLWMGTGGRSYANDGTATQPVHAYC